MAYIRVGDSGSASYCLEKLLSVPAVAEETAAKTDPLTHLTGNVTQLVSPAA